MREIKFRFWCKLTKSFLDNYCAIIGSGKILSYCFETEKWGEVVPEVVSETLEINQFTGLHDSKGREIYEGDVVKSSSWSSLAKISYKNGAFRIIKPNYNSDFVLDCDEIKINQIEVVGNIFENPELFEADNET
jgi:uncharacterized phage protein (TIGR01671 family)